MNSFGELLPLRVVLDPSILDIIHGLDKGLVDELASKPSFADDGVFEIVLERRFC